MPDLWVYKRRPNSTTRHKHGGFNASFPMNGHTVIGQMALDEWARKVEEIRKAQAEAAPVEAEASNILSFADRRGRAARAPSTHRGGKRPGDGAGRDGSGRDGGMRDRD